MREPRSTALSEFLSQQRALVDEALERYLPTPSFSPAILADAMRYSIQAGGKRLRPILTLAAAEAVGGRDAINLALPAACAIEFIHTYSLIHDDLPAMDNDTLRRGQPTNHIVFGEAMAILAGDGLLTAAFMLLAHEPDDPRLADRKLRVIQIVSSAGGASGMVGGQALDLQSTKWPSDAHEYSTLKAPSLDPAALSAMHARKTGALIRASAVAGAVIAGGADPVIAAIDSYATELGLAFQITDDLLDVEGEAKTLGKTVGKDAAAGKSTYVTLYGIDGSRQRAQQSAERARDALDRAGFFQSRLYDLIDWVIERDA